MGSPRLLLALAFAALAAGCVVDDESVADEPSGADPTLLLKQYYDIVAPPASDCAGAGTTEWAPAEFDVPRTTTWARIEGTFASGRIGLDARDADGRRLGFAAAGSPVVVDVEGIIASKIVVRAYACDGTPRTDVRVFATFRSAPP